MKQIPITEIQGFSIGQAENREAGTGLTVILCGEEGACAGLDVRGGGPASRESQLLNPLMNADWINAVVLGGGSAFGLDAAGGVQQYLEERNIGYDVGITKVPLVCQSDIFDLGVGDYRVRPDREMGYKACENAGNYQDGNFGAGTGATVGKLRGPKYMMKAGIGSYAVQVGELKIGAIVAVNAVGDVYDHKTGQILAGVRKEDGSGFVSGQDLMIAGYEQMSQLAGQNTTIGVILTNASFNKAQLCKIAGMAHDGYARSIKPVHTMADGDSIYALSKGDVKADISMVGALAAEVMSEAIYTAVRSAETAYGIPGLKG